MYAEPGDVFLFALDLFFYQNSLKYGKTFEFFLGKEDGFLLIRNSLKRIFCSFSFF
jgi:hypothetical protein